MPSMRAPVVVAAATIGVALAACTTGNPVAPTSVPAPPPVTVVPQAIGAFSDPRADQRIETASIVVNGTYGPAGLSSPLWVLVWPDLAPGVGFPQSANAAAGEPATKNTATTWTTSATFGGPPQGYELILYSATPEASNVLAIAVRAGAAGLARVPTPGLTTLPTGLTPLHSIRVTRAPLAIITEPGAGFASATPNLVVRGSYAAGTNDNIWVLVFPDQANGLAYPQSPNAAAGLPATKDPTRLTWSVPISLGGPPQTYDIRVFTTDAFASNALSQTLIRWVAQNFFPGLSPAELPPSGLFEQHKITISKR